MGDKNAFGGIARSLYTPMSEDEQEVLQRLVATRDLDVIIKGWGYIQGIQGAIAGDLRLSLPLVLDFDRPAVPQAVHYFDLELRTGSGTLLFAERQGTVYSGQPLLVSAGTNLSMVWEIAIKHMDPKIVKAYKPGAQGLTSRWQDRDTGRMTMFGNTRMNQQDQKALLNLRKKEAQSRADTKRVAQRATLAATKKK